MHSDRLPRRAAAVVAATMAAGFGAFFAAGLTASAHGNPHPASAPANPGQSGHSPRGDANAGDVWTDNVGRPAGPGHEQDPHLACADINLLGNGLADATGSYSVDGWPPSGRQEVDYTSTWQYNLAQGGDQVISVIDVQQLIATAVANGDTPNSKQGFHFKLNLTQDPQKHKTFWVSCVTAPSPTPRPGPTTTPVPTPPTNSPGPSGAGGGSTPTPGGGNGAVQPVTSGGGGGGGGNSPGNVLGVSTSVPATGVTVAAGLAAGLVGLGAALMIGSRRRHPRLN